MKLVTKCTHKLRQFKIFTTTSILSHVGNIKILLALGSKGPVGSVGRHGTGEHESGDLM